MREAKHHADSAVREFSLVDQRNDSPQVIWRQCATRVIETSLIARALPCPPRFALVCPTVNDWDCSTRDYRMNAGRASPLAFGGWQCPRQRDGMIQPSQRRAPSHSRHGRDNLAIPNIR